jgi:hypothetical protein
MTREKERTRPSEKLFAEPQPHMFDQSYEERLREQNQQPVECLGMTFPNDEARRQYFLEKLREKLKDPEFRKIEGFPIGSDEDILTLSDPPYYTACPNPFIEECVKRYGKPYDPATDNYRREPFAADVSEGKHDPIYKAHTYHTKVPPKAIKKYIEHYSDDGDVILDPFAGSGMTGVAGRLSSRRIVIQNDLAPAATHIAAGYAIPWNMVAFRKRAEEIIFEARRSHMERFYAIESDKQIGEIKYCVWSDVFACDSCSETYTFADAAVDLRSKTIFNKYHCPHCGAEQSKSSANYTHEIIYDPYLRRTITWNKRQPFWIVYERSGKRLKRRMNEAEIKEATAVPGQPEATHFTIVPFMLRDDRWGCLYRAGYHFGMTHSHHFYTWRSLSLLDHIWGLINDSYPELIPHLRFWFLATAIKCSKLMTYNADGIGRVMKGNLYISSLIQEVNPIHFLEITLRDMCSAMALLPSDSRQVYTSTSSASTLHLPNDSIDYVFVDPPFGDNLIYSELNFLWECWLKVFTRENAETIVNPGFGKTLDTYTKGMTEGFSEIFRVLKPGRWITVEFHNSKNAIWVSLQQALEISGFVIADVRVLDKKHGSIKQVQTAGAVKQDLIISAYKPNGGLEERFKLTAGTEDGVWHFIRTHLKQLPVFVSKDGQAELIAERQNYLLFDRMVAFHVQRGVTVPLSAAEFYQGLTQRFPERDSMYFLPEQAAEYDKKRLTVKEVLQLELFVIDEASAIQWLRQQLIAKPQTFQDLHPQFLREIGGWQKHEKPLELSELLADNFLRYDGQSEVPGQVHSYLSSNFKELRNLPKDAPALRVKAKDRWYVPDPNKATDLEKLRDRRLMKEFQEYRESKQKKIKVFRLEAVRAGFKKAWQERDYPTIIEVARKIPETILQEDPKLLMWYDQALTRMGTAG